MNPVGLLYDNRMQLHAAIEFACMDLAGKFLNIRACDLIGGALREEVPVRGLSVYRYRDDKTGQRAARSPPTDGGARPRPRRAARLQPPQAERRPFAPEHDVEVIRALGTDFPKRRHRARPRQRPERRGRRSASQGDRPISTTIISRTPARGSRACAGLPTPSNIPTATNTVVVDFEQLAACIRAQNDTT